MAFCVHCGASLPDDATFCTNCGAPVNPGSGLIPYVDPTDHTAEFDGADISANKVFAMSAYLMGIIGILLALLAARDSKYIGFHCRQAMKLEVLTVLIGIISAVLCWTVVIPIAGGVCGLILLVVKVICFFQVCSGKAKEAPIVSSLGFLK